MSSCYLVINFLFQTYGLSVDFQEQTEWKLGTHQKAPGKTGDAGKDQMISPGQQPRDHSERKVLKRCTFSPDDPKTSMELKLLGGNKKGLRSVFYPLTFGWVPVTLVINFLFQTYGLSVDFQEQTEWKLGTDQKAPGKTGDAGKDQMISPGQQPRDHSERKVLKRCTFSPDDPKTSMELKLLGGNKKGLRSVFYPLTFGWVPVTW